MVYCPVGQTHKQLFEMNNSRVDQGCQRILPECVLSLNTNASYPQCINFLLPGHFIHYCFSAEGEKHSAT